MSSDSNALTERVISSFTKLSSAAKNLNNVSDELGRAITAIDYVLQRLNLGVPTWVKIHGGEDQYTGMEYWSRDVGYSKIGNRWGIALCTREGDWNNPDEERREEWHFNDAPRWLRIEAVEKIPDLLEELIKNTEETTAKIKGKIDHAKQLAGALEQAAAGKPTSKKAVVSQSPTDVSGLKKTMADAGAAAMAIDTSALKKTMADTSALSKARANADLWKFPKGKK